MSSGLNKASNVGPKKTVTTVTNKTTAIKPTTKTTTTVDVTVAKPTQITKVGVTTTTKPTQITKPTITTTAKQTITKTPTNIIKKPAITVKPIITKTIQTTTTKPTTKPTTNQTNQPNLTKIAAKPAKLFTNTETTTNAIEKPTITTTTLTKTTQKSQTNNKTAIETKKPHQQKPVPKYGNTNKEIIFQVLDWRASHYKDNVKNIDDDDNKSSESIESDNSSDDKDKMDKDLINQYSIDLYGNTMDGQTIYAQIINYKPSFYILVPDEWFTKKSYADIFLKNLKSKLGNSPHKNSFYKWEIEKKHSFTEFTNNKYFTFLKLYFHDHYGFKKYSSMFHSYNKSTGEHYYTAFTDASIGLKNHRFVIYESKLDPLLRYMHERDLKSLGFIKLEPRKYRLLGDVSINNINVVVDWNDTFFHDNDMILKLKVASYDIECKPEDGINFPKPQNPGDTVIQIGTTFNFYGTADCYYKHIITLDTCSPIEGVDVESYQTETEVLLAWSKLIQRTNPDIITGYNIVQFDFMYLYERAKFLGIEAEFSKLGRLKDKSCTYVETKLESNALGDNMLRYYTMEGRVVIDMLKVMQRDYKLSSYKLDDVVAEFIKERVCKIEYNEETGITKIHTKTTFGLYEDRFIRLYYNDSLSDYTCEDSNGKKKNKVIKIEKAAYKLVNKEGKDESYDIIHLRTSFTEEVKNILTKKKYALYWCQAKDDMPPRKMFELQGKGPDDRALVAKYCIQDCILCNVLMEKLQVLTNNIGMANVCHVPLSFIFFRGQGIKIQSLVAKKCKSENYVMKDLFRNKNKEQLRKEEEQRRALFDKDYVKPSEIILTDQQKAKQKEEANRLASAKRNMKKNYEVNQKTIKYLQNMIVKLKRLPETDPNKEEKIEFYQQSLKIYEKIFKKEKIKYMTLEDEIEKNAEEDGYEGATVFTPKTGKYDKPITVLDYASLYPSSMIQKNLCISSLVTDPQYDNLPGYKYTDVTYYHTNGTGSTTCRFAKPKDGTPSILPQILIELLKKRGEMRNRAEEMMEQGNKFLAKVLDGLQLAYKVTANSLYGQTGSPVSAIYKKEIAASTTATGREQLMGAKRFVEIIYGALANFATDDNFDEYKKLCDYTFDTNLCEGTLIFCDYNLNESKFKDFQKPARFNNREEFIRWTFDEFRRILEDNVINPEIIYGDTDSVFINYNMRNKDTQVFLQDKDGLKRAIKLGIVCSMLINIIQPPPQNLQYEKTLWPFIILSKKRYIGNLYEKDPEKFYQKSMGIVLKRRDNAPIVKIVVGGIVDMLINEQNLEGAKIFTNNELLNILNNKYSLDKFIISKTLKGTYANRAGVAHAVLADRMAERDPGNKPETNDRIPYAYIIPKIKKKDSKQSDFIEHKDYIMENKLPIDYLFYITNQIMKPALQFLLTVMEKPEKIFFRHILVETNRRKGLMPLAFYFNNPKLTPQATNNNKDECLNDDQPVDTIEDDANESSFDKFAAMNVKADNGNRFASFVSNNKRSRVKKNPTVTLEPKVTRKKTTTTRITKKKALAESESELSVDAPTESCEEIDTVVAEPEACTELTMDEPIESCEEIDTPTPSLTVIEPKLTTKQNKPTNTLLTRKVVKRSEAVRKTSKTKSASLTKKVLIKKAKPISTMTSFNKSTED
jgi:DNA polymerase elongation subunit (family B)